jgi:hypothetical protein
MDSPETVATTIRNLEALAKSKDENKHSTSDYVTVSLQQAPQPMPWETDIIDIIDEATYCADMAIHGGVGKQIRKAQLAAARALFETMRQKAYEAGWLREFETLYYWEAHELGVKQLGE